MDNRVEAHGLRRTIWNCLKFKRKIKEGENERENEWENQLCCINNTLPVHLESRTANSMQFLVHNSSLFSSCFLSSFFSLFFNRFHTSSSYRELLPMREQGSQWFILDLTIIEASDYLSLNNLSSSAASALVSPVSVLVSTPCMIPSNRAWHCSALHHCPSCCCLLLPNPSFLFFNSRLSRRLLFSSSRSILKSRTKTASSGPHNSFNSCHYDTLHHCLPVSLMSILVRHRRRRRIP